MGSDGLTISVHAHAKVNLVLRVGAPRSDGMHPIASWIHSIGLADTVEITRGPPGFSVVRDTGEPVGWDPEDDLARRAQRALEAHVGRALEASVSVVKRVPDGGGLGGGSSDAASVLLGLNELFELGLSDAELRAVSSAVGSDIAYFIDTEHFARREPAPPAIVSGVGERIERVERSGSDLTLLIPGGGCSTPEVYRRFDALNPDPTSLDSVEIGAGPDPRDADLVNDLAIPARSVLPEIGEIQDHLARCGMRAHVSGSGSTLFVLGHPELPEAIGSGVRVVRTRLV